MSYGSYKLTKKDMEQIQKFGGEIKTGFYGNRGQNNNNKRKLDQITGKAGEICAFHLLKKEFPDLTKPDFAIYGVGKKSWDYDMKCKDRNIHIKTQSIASAERYKPSWVFEKTDKKIFVDYTDNDYVAFVQFDTDKSIGQIMAFVKVKDLHDKKLFKEMVNKNLTTKSAVYYSDLEKMK
jgi:hypothetical protein